MLGWAPRREQQRMQFGQESLRALPRGPPERRRFSTPGPLLNPTLLVPTTRSSACAYDLERNYHHDLGRRDDEYAVVQKLVAALIVMMIMAI